MYHIDYGIRFYVVRISIQNEAISFTWKSCLIVNKRFMILSDTRFGKAAFFIVLEQLKSQKVNFVKNEDIFKY